MSSPEQCYDEFCSPVGSPPAETYEEFLEKQDANSSSSPSCSEDKLSDSDMLEIQREKEALLTLVSPPQPTGMPLLGCPFVLKLYLAAGSSAITMINWSQNGRQLVVNYKALQDHLTAGSQIFRSRSVKQFAAKLRAEGFLRILPDRPLGRAAANVKSMPLYFQQPQFVRGALGSLRKLMEESLLIEKYYPMGAQYGQGAENEEEEEPQFRVPLHMPSKSHIERMQQRGDKCCSIISVRSPSQEAHCRLRTLLNHQSTYKEVQASADLWKDASMKKGSRSWDFPAFTSSKIKFVRPHDSVIILNANRPLPEYAGYYGQVSPTKVNKFFGDSLPRYGNKTTGYKDVVMETTQKASNFQQNLPIGLASSEGEGDDPDDVPPPVSPAGHDSDMDCMPSTSAAAAAAAAKRSSGRQISADSVDDQDLEEAMQELCGGSTARKENVSSGSRGKAKGQPQPKTTSRKRRAKSFESSSSENEAEVSRKPKRAKKSTVKESIQEEAIGEYQETLPKKRGPTKAKTPRATSRKRFASPNTDEASPPRKKALKDSRKTKQLEELEEFVVKKKRGQTKKHPRETDEENEYKEAEESEYAFQDEVENGEENDYVEEIPEEYEQPEEDEQPEYEEDEYSQEEHHGEEYLQQEYPEEQPEAEYQEGEYTEGEYPEGEYPEGEYPEGEYREREYPEGEYPERKYPEGKYQEGEYSEGKYQEGEYPEGEYTEGEYPEGKYKEGEYPDGEYPEGEYPEGEYPEGEYQEGEYPEGKYQEGQYPEGEYTEGEYPEGKYQEGEYQEGEYPEGKYQKGEYPEGEYPAAEYPEGEEYPGEEYQPEEGQPEEERTEEEQPMYPEEDEQPEEDINEDDAQEPEVDANNDEDLVAEEEQDVEEESEDEEDEDDKDDQDTEATDTDTDTEDDDDDDDDYSVQYRAAPPDPEKPRRYDLRNSMRKSN